MAEGLKREMCDSGTKYAVCETLNSKPASD